MDSSTVGIPRKGPAATTSGSPCRAISNSGEFVHAAPWSTGSQGSANVSHGCVTSPPPTPPGSFSARPAAATWSRSEARPNARAAASASPTGTCPGPGGWPAAPCPADHESARLDLQRSATCAVVGQGHVELGRLGRAGDQGRVPACTAASVSSLPLSSLFMASVCLAQSARHQDGWRMVLLARSTASAHSGGGGGGGHTARGRLRGAGPVAVGVAGCRRWPPRRPATRHHARVTRARARLPPPLSTSRAWPVVLAADVEVGDVTAKGGKLALAGVVVLCEASFPPSGPCSTGPKPAQASRVPGESYQKTGAAPSAKSRRPPARRPQDPRLTHAVDLVVAVVERAARRRRTSRASGSGRSGPSAPWVWGPVDHVVQHWARRT